MKKYFELCRVKHWIKNLLIFLPLICSNSFTKNNIITTILGFFSFSFLTSFVYIINDIKDIEKDKQHPRKKNRPLPSGKIKISTAIAISIIMLALSIGINTYITSNIFNTSILFIVSYLIINISYSYGLKNIAIIDISLLSAGFVIRVYYGASLIGVDISQWLFLTILSASLFLGLGKRKKELQTNKESRKVLKKYNYEFLDKFQYMFLTSIICFYSLWCTEQNIKNIIFSIPILIMIFMKYSLDMELGDEGDPTTILYKDKLLFALCVIYGGIMMAFFLIK